MAAARHAKPRKSVVKQIVVPGAAAVTLAGAAAAFMSIPSGPVPVPAAHLGGAQASGTVAGSLADPSIGVANVSAHQAIGGAQTRQVRAAGQERLRHEAAARAARAAQARAAQQAAARQAAAQQAAAQATSTPAPSPSPSSTAPSTGGGDAADSALGVCIRTAEEGGSYAWGPGNGGGAYQFEIGTWETYGGAASEFGVADAAYQNQIFDNAIAAGGASNWTQYDGC